MPRSNGPSKILEKVGPNTYKVDLPGDYGVSATFNVAYLSPYYDENDEISSLRSNSNLAGENDGDHQAKVPNASEEVKEVQRSVNKVKELHAMVRSALTQNHSLLFSSTENWPDFVHVCSKGNWGLLIKTFTLFKLKKSSFQ